MVQKPHRAQFLHQSSNSKIVKSNFS